MLVIIIRSIIIFLVLVLGMRLMGKRTLGELQPYEFVIVLAIADLAVTPMQDIAISIFYGLVPLGVVIILHYAITAVTAKSIKARKLLNGKPFIIIDDDGINSNTLKKLNIDVNDLLAGIRQQGYFSIQQIKYGIIETNGKLSLLQDDQAKPPNSIPMTLVVEGKILDENISAVNVTEEQIYKLLQENGLKLQDVLLLTADSKDIFIQPRNAKYIEVTVQ
ncbi:MAG: DUF421 domain-containing protein [Clostridiales bacterium]|nr:DUF421 domain-containing protein [Clostridiales bacterium]